MGDDWVSAKPSELLTYAQNALDIDSELWGQGERLRWALERFRSSHPDGKYISSIAPLDKNVQELAVHARKTDDWVGRVAEAFRDLGTGGLLADYSVQTVRGTQLEKQIPKEEQHLLNDLQKAHLADGEDDAARFRKAVLEHDVGALAALRAKLAANVNDKYYTAGFFKALGPHETLGAALDLKDDPAAQKVFAEALGTATRSPAWDPSFNRNLVRGDDSFPGHYDRIEALRALLGHGVYSADFLTQTLDGTIMPSSPSSYGPTSGRTLTPIALEALARNPEAAAKYLGGQFDGHPRLRFLGLTSAIDGHGKALGDAIAAGGAAPDRDNGPKLAMLRAVGELDWRDEDSLPVDARAGVAIAVSRSAGVLAWKASDDDSDRRRWMPGLFSMAELNGNGALDANRARTVMAGLNAYLYSHMATGSDPRRTNGADHGLGRLYASGIVPMVEAVYASKAEGDSFKHGLEHTQTGLTALGIILAPVKMSPVTAVGVQGGQAAVDAALDAAINSRENHDAHLANGASNRLSAEAVNRFRIIAVQGAVLRNPAILPGDPDDPNSLAHLARTNPQDPRVADRVAALAQQTLPQDMAKLTDAEKDLRLGIEAGGMAFYQQDFDSHPESAIH